MRDHGLAIVKGVLEPPEVAALRADVLALLDPNDDAPAAITRTLYAFVEHSPAAAELLRNQRFMEIHRAICGSDESSGLTLHRTVASLKTAGEGPLEWHRDRATHYPAGPPQTSGQVLNTGPEPNGMYFYLNGCRSAARTHTSRCSRRRATRVRGNRMVSTKFKFTPSHASPQPGARRHRGDPRQPAHGLRAAGGVRVLQHRPV